MRILGLAVILGGWILAMSGLFISSSNMVRAIFASAGILVTAFGMFGILNKYYLANAIWKKQ